MQRRVDGGGITTTDEHVEHGPGCASVSHPGMSCEEAQLMFKKGRLPRTTGSGVRPGLLRKAPSR